MIISYRNIIRVRNAMARRFALDESSIYIGCLLVMDSLFDFISFRVIVFSFVRSYLYIVLFSLHDS